MIPAGGILRRGPARVVLAYMQDLEEAADTPPQYRSLRQRVAMDLNLRVTWGPEGPPSKRAAR